jgi:hypothetical protein
VTHPGSIVTLDSLIHHADRFALNTSDYAHGILDGFITGRLHLLNSVDTLRTDSLMHRVALHFYTDLAYGNHAPSLQNDGLEFKLNTMNVPELLSKHTSSQGLIQLTHIFTSMSKEVGTLLATVNQYQDSSHINPFRLRQLIKAVNDYRWLRALSEKQKVILVNIPSAQLKVYESEKMILAMKLVVGKASTPTNSFSTIIKQITINPYWNVPKSIATKEMLPQLKKDNDYLERNHLQVLNTNYRVIKSEGIDWNNYSESNFPFYIRQSTGCDNSLGIIKLEFESPYGVYLHDTPEKSLFNYTNRFYSHGCMRMEKPIEIAKLLMKENRAALDTINLETCYKNPNPITIPIPNSTPLVVWYSLIDFDAQGNIKFYKDVYHRFTY